MIREICKVPSISFGVMHNGTVVFRESIGLRDVELNLDADSDTSYGIASCSKMITSTALAMLEEDGGLSWEDTIRSHLKDFQPSEDPEMGSKATIMDACRHSTGLANPVAVMVAPGNAINVTDEDYVAMVNALPTSNASGQRYVNWWYYSNAAFGLMAKVVEAVSNTAFPTFLRERILGPLAMKQTLLTRAEMEHNSNVARNYVQMNDGSWSRIADDFAPETSHALLACLGIRSSVNDLLAFFAAVLNRHDVEAGFEPPQLLLNGVSQNPLRGIKSMWNHWWTRPWEDGFDNEAAYLLGWFRTKMPSAAVGSMSYNFYRYLGDDKPYMKYIIGKESEPRMLIGHNGIANGSVAAAYVLPETHSAVVVLSNAADAGDAAESTAEILLQALFDLQPRVNIVEATKDARDRCLEAYEKMLADWRRGRNISNYQGSPDDYAGTYVGLNVSKIHIVHSSSAAAKLAVTFGHDQGLKCDLVPYNDDALSFLPLKHDELLRRAMIDWDYYKVGIFEFVRRYGIVVGLWWQWDEHDYPGLWVKERNDMTNDEKADIIRELGAFRKHAREQGINGANDHTEEVGTPGEPIAGNGITDEETAAVANVSGPLERLIDQPKAKIWRRFRCTVM
jgi:CubicO group peptidase (beta-lactamase class C family)